MTERGGQSGFEKHWMPAWEAEKAFDGCTIYVSRNGSYRSGRDRWAWTAVNGGRVSETRDAMELTSKKGKMYMVVSRYPQGVWG